MVTDGFLVNGAPLQGSRFNRIITPYQPELPRDPSLINDRKAGYKTRRDKVFGDERCTVRWHYWSKKNLS